MHVDWASVPAAEDRVKVFKGVIVTLVVAGAEHPLPSVTITVYVPEAAGVTFVIDGFWVNAVKLFGPVQL